MRSPAFTVLRYAAKGALGSYLCGNIRVGSTARRISRLAQICCTAPATGPLCFRQLCSFHPTDGQLALRLWHAIAIQAMSPHEQMHPVPPVSSDPLVS